jgi:phospholipid/cholesterol/gamma-HCH transport system substrate-binding protein
MADKTKSQLAQLRVGILALVALFFVTLLVFLLTGGSGWFVKMIPLTVYVSDASGLSGGSPVRINGITAGKVKSVGLSGETNPRRVIRVYFEVNQEMLKQIPVDSVASIGSDNLLGSTKYLDITKGVKPETLQAGATMRSEETQQFDQLVKQGFGVLDSAQGILVQIQNLVGQIENGQGTIGKFLVDPSLYNSLQATVMQLQQLSTTLNSRTGTIGHLINDDTLYKEAQTIAGRLDTMTQALQQGQGTAGMLLTDKKLYENVDQAVAELNTTLTNLNAGKGTAGQLLTNDKIANQLSATLTNVNTTIDKMNAGQGTIGQLLVNPQLYDNLIGSTRELQDTLKAFRANPKKYLSIKLHIF